MNPHRERSLGHRFTPARRRSRTGRRLVYEILEERLVLSAGPDITQGLAVQTGPVAPDLLALTASLERLTVA